MANINPYIQKEQQPLNTKVLDIDTFVKTYNIQEVTSHSIYTASTNLFHPQGLFSEEIFGQIGTTERLVSFGYINLQVPILEPTIYKSIVSLKRLYGEIMMGSAYAIYDPEEGDFIRCQFDHPYGQTGYTFFNKHFPKILHEATTSRKRDKHIQLLAKYKDLWYSSKQLVSPAGVRDISVEDKVLAEEDVNKLYLALMSYSSSMPKSDKSIYDSIRVNILKKRIEIYEYYENLLKDKKGFLQFGIGRRTIAFGTRNVISAAAMDAKYPGDPRSLKYDESFCPLFQTAKAFQPLVTYQLRKLAFDNIFTSGASQLPLIDPKTFQLKYVEVDASIVEFYRSADGFDSIVNQCQDTHYLYKSITITGLDKVAYYLYLVYDLGDKIYYFRNIDDLVNLYKGGEIDRSKIRPLTWMELLYVCTSLATVNKHVLITRYPIGQGPDSVVPTKIRLLSTTPNREVSLVDITNEYNSRTFYHYPIIDKNVVGSLALFPGRLSGLSGDFDGDQVSLNSVMGKDSNAQVVDYLGGWESLISPQMQLYTGANTDNTSMAVFCLSLDRDKVLEQ